MGIKIVFHHPECALLPKYHNGFKIGKCNCIPAKNPTDKDKYIPAKLKDTK